MDETVISNYLGGISLHLCPSHAIERYILTHGEWEPHLSTYLSSFVRPGFCCVDVGANSGVHTLTMASLVGDTGSVLAFEPNPDYLARLVRNIALNETFGSRIEYRQVGLSDAAGSLKIFESGELFGNAYLAESRDETLWNRFSEDVFTTCQVATLDEEIGSRRVDLIKIDVEGMEAKVLQGALNTVARDRPILVYESLIRDFGEERVGKMNQLVMDQGYYRFFLHPGLKKLTTCYFPRLPEDVLAIHPDRLLSAFPLMQNGVRYVFNTTETVALFGDVVHLTVIGLGSDTYAVVWSQSDDDSPKMKVTKDLGDGILVFEQTWRGVKLRTFANVIFHHPKGFQECPVAAVQIEGPQGVLTAISEETAGILYPYGPNSGEC